jgi:hypothetical protein
MVRESSSRVGQDHWTSRPRRGAPRPGRPNIGRFTLLESLQGSERRVLTLALVRRLGSPRKRGDVMARGRKRCYLIVALLTAGAVGCAWLGGGGLPDWDGIIYAGLLVALIRFPELTWREFQERVAPHLDEIVRSPSERGMAAESMRQLLKHSRQCWSSVVAAGASCTFAVLAARAGNSDLVWDLPFITMVTVAGFLGGNTVYWLLAAADWLRRFRSLKSLRLTSIPDIDPGIVECRALLRSVMFRVAAGLFLCEVPLLVLDTTGRESEFLLVATGGIALLCTGTLLAVTIGPALYLGRVLRVDQLNECQELNLAFQRLVVPESERLWMRFGLIETTNAIMARPVHKVDFPVFLTVATSLAAVVLPYIIAVLLELPHLM